MLTATQTKTNENVLLDPELLLMDLPGANAAATANTSNTTAEYLIPSDREQYNALTLWSALCGIPLHLQSLGQGTVSFYTFNQHNQYERLTQAQRSIYGFEAEVAMLEYRCNATQKVFQVFYPVNNNPSNGTLNAAGTTSYRSRKPAASTENVTQIWPIAECQSRAHWVFAVQENGKTVVHDSTASLQRLRLWGHTRDESAIQQVFGHGVSFQYAGVQGVRDTVNCGRYLALGVANLLTGGCQQAIFPAQIDSANRNYLHDMARTSFAHLVRGEDIPKKEVFDENSDTVCVVENSEAPEEDFEDFCMVTPTTQPPQEMHGHQERVDYSIPQNHTFAVTSTNSLL